LQNKSEFAPSMRKWVRENRENWRVHFRGQKIKKHLVHKMVYQKGGHDAKDSAGGGEAVREQQQRHRDDHQPSHQDALHRLLEDRQVLVRVQEVAVVHPRLQLRQTNRILEISLLLSFGKI
jgi:hypothetical protein